MRFSIVVPTLNEELDIRGTLDALTALKAEGKEIIVADDSSDHTPDIVKEYESKNVRLIHPAGGGRCEARNIGIKEAHGDIVVILNADVRLPIDFISKISAHYASGADYVLVRSRVSNLQNLYPRFIDSLSQREYARPDAFDRMNWTEGFSCRRESALRAGLFPTGYSMPLCAGEDGYFAAGLLRTGAKKVMDLSIMVEHVAPSSFSDFWKARREKGIGSAQVHRFLYKWSFPFIVTWNAAKSIRTLLWFFLAIPVAWSAVRLSGWSDRRYKDVLAFAYVLCVDKLAFHVGEWSTTYRIWRSNASNRNRRLGVQK